MDSIYTIPENNIICPIWSWKKLQITHFKNKNIHQHGSQGEQMYSDYAWWPESIPKSSSLILSHLSLFSLANTMSSAPRRIIVLRCRRQTIYWHFASLNNSVSLPETIHFQPYMLYSLRPTHLFRCQLFIFRKDSMRRLVFKWFNIFKYQTCWFPLSIFQLIWMMDVANTGLNQQFIVRQRTA